MKKEWSEIAYYGLASAKGEVIDSTIKKISEMSTTPKFLIKGGKIAVSIAVFYNHRTFKKMEEIKYFVFMDDTKKQIRYSKLPIIKKVCPGDATTVVLLIQEKK